MKKLIRDNILRVVPYQSGKPIELLRRELKIKDEIIKLASNENPLGPSPLAISAMRSVLKECNFYPDDTCYALREKLAHYVGVAPENLKIGNGITEFFFTIGIAFLNPGENVVMSKPSFIMGKLATNILGHKLIEVPLKDYRHDLPAILNAVTKDTKIIYLDNPINPIGTMIGQQEVVEFMDEVPDDVIVVFDEAYYEYIDRKDYPDTIKFVKQGRNVIVLRTFSKIYGLAGLRVGYAIAKPSFIDALSRASFPFSVSRVAQAGAIAAMDDKEHIERTKRINEAGKKFLYQNFERLGIFYIPSQTNFITIDIQTGSRSAPTRAKKIYEFLEQENIIVRPLTQYDEPTLLRVTIGTQEQNEQLILALKKFYDRLSEAKS